MRLGDFLLALAFHTGGDKNAVLLAYHRGKSHTILDSAVQSTDISYDTPVVNLLQHLPVDKVTNCWLYATYVPSEMDLGMACMRGVQGIVYPRDKNVAVQRTFSDQTGPGAVAAFGGDNSWDLWITDPRERQLDVPWGA